MPEVRHSVCALDCPDCCSLLINVEDGQGSRFARKSRSSCDARFPVRQSGAVSGTRILAVPVALSAEAHRRERPGKIQRISWDEALDTIADPAERNLPPSIGPEAILPYSYAGTMGLLNGSGMDRRFFHRLGASRLDRTICSAAGTRGSHGDARRSLRHRARTVSPLQADHRLGREYARHQRSPVAVYRGGAA